MPPRGVRRWLEANVILIEYVAINGTAYITNGVSAELALSTLVNLVPELHAEILSPDVWARCRMMRSGSVIRVDSADCVTIIPNGRPL